MSPKRKFVVQILDGRPLDDVEYKHPLEARDAEAGEVNN